MNEEDRIADCLDSLAFCDEIICVDSHSTDRTREIAAEKGARVVERDWPGFRGQKEFAAAMASNDWILSLDADERVSQRLRGEIEALREQGFPQHAGWSMPRLSSYLGGWMRHGSWYPDRQLRLYNRSHGEWVAREPHPRVEVRGSTGRLKGDLEHHPFRTFEEHLATIDKYTTIMAAEMAKEGKRASVADIVVAPTLRFLKFYVVKRGFLDGWRGILMAYLAAHYGRLKYAKLLVAQRETATPK